MHVNVASQRLVLNPCACAVVLLIALAGHAADPIWVGQWPGYMRGPATAVAISINYAYVACAEAGLQVIDIGDPANPVRVGGCDYRR